MIGISTKPSLHRDFALMSVIIIFILLLASVWVVYETYEAHSEKILRQLENESVRVDRALIVEIENSAYLLESLGRQISHFGTMDPREIGQLLQSFDAQGYAKSNVLSWVNPNQEISVSSNKGIISKPVDISDRDYVKKALSVPWQVHIGRPTEGRVSERWVIPMALGITDYSGEYLGSLVISLDVNNLTRRIQTQIKDDAISFAITNKSFTLLTQAADTRNFYSEHFDRDRLNSLLLQNKPSGIYSRANLFDGRTISAYYEVSSQYPYIILIGYNDRLNKGAIIEILWPRLLQLLVIVFFLLFVLWVVRNRVIAPVVELAKGAEAVVQGKENSLPENIQGPTEIEQLAYQIRRLTDYVQERVRIEGELINKNNTLLRIKESAQLTNEVKAEFLEEIAHALQVPVKNILERGEAILGQMFGLIGETKYLDQADDIVRAAKDIGLMVDEIKRISEAETGLLALNESAVDLHFVVQKCLRIYQGKSRYRDIEVQLHMDEGMPKLYADELRIKQIVLNLLQSAAAQVQGGDSFTLEVMILKDECIVQVTFVPNRKEPERKRHVPYFAAPPNITDNAKESEALQTIGMGIILTKLLVALHEGALTIRNRATRGTSITVKFPAKRVIAIG